MSAQEVGKPFTLFITHVDSEGANLKICGQCNKDAAIYVESLLTQCKDQLDNVVSSLPPEGLLEGIICVAKYKDGAYYRAKIVSRALIDKGLVCLQFIDFGNRDVVEIENVKPLTSCHSHLGTMPAQANDYILARIVEPSQCWSEATVNKFRSLLCYNEYTCTIESKSYTHMFVGMLFDNVDFSHYLVLNKFGVRVSVEQQQDIIEKYKSESALHKPMMPSAFSVLGVSNTNYVEHVPFSSPQNFPSNPAAAMRIHNVAGPQLHRGYVPPVRTPFAVPPPVKTTSMNQRLVVAKTPKAATPLRQPNTTVPSSVLVRKVPQAEEPKEIPTSPYRSSTYKVKHLEIGSTHEVQLAFLEDGPSKFFIHLVRNAQRFQALVDEMNRHPVSSLRAPPITGTVCLGRKSVNRVICRASVAEVSENNCLLYFVDFGVYEQVAYHDIFDIPERFIEPEVFAHCISLSKIKSLPSSNETNECFRKLVTGQRMLMKVVQPEGPPLVQYGELHINGKSVWELLSSLVEPVDYPEPAQLPLGQSVSVMVSYVDSCLKFYVQFTDNIKSLEDIMKSVEEHCSLVAPVIPKENAACCALFPDDERWYRARVLKVNAETALVYYVDYGNEQEVHMENIKPITSELASYPAQAIRCALKGFEDKPVDQITSNQLEMLALEKALTARVVGQIPDVATLVSLFDDSVSPVMDVAKRMVQLTQPRGSKGDKDPTSPVPSPERNEEWAQKSFRNKGERGGKESFDRGVITRHSEKRPTRNEGWDSTESRGGGSRDQENERGWGRDKKTKPMSHRSDQNSDHGSQASSNSDTQPKRNYGQRQHPKNSVQHRLNRADDAKGSGRYGGNKANDDWEANPTERKSFNRDDRRSGPRGDRKDNWGEKKESWEVGERDKIESWGGGDREKKDRWGDGDREKKDRWGDGDREKKDRWGDGDREKKDRWGDGDREKKDRWGDGDRERKGGRSGGDRDNKDSWVGNDRDKKDSWGDRQKKDSWGGGESDRRDKWGEKKEGFGSRNEDSRGERREFRGGRGDGAPRDRADRSFESSSNSRPRRGPPPVKELPNPVPLDTQYEMPPIEIGSQIEVSVAWLISPDSFYAQIVSLQPDFIAMMNKIPELYKGVKNYSGTIEVGATVLARFPEDKVLYRATVLGVQPFGKYIVQYIDFGNKHLVEAKDIWQLDSDLMVLPKMAVHSSLSGVKPLEDEWKTSNEMDLCFNAPRYQCIFHDLCDDRYKVSLWNNGMSVAQMMADKGLCTLVDENSSYTLKDEPIDLCMIVGQQMMCKITHVESFEKMFLQLDLQKAKTVEDSISAYDQTLLIPLTDENFVSGTHCLLRHDDKLFRAVIANADNKEAFEAALPDYGKSVTAPSEKFMFLPTELTLYYYQSLECSLNNYNADSTKLVTDDELKQKLEGNDFIAFIDDIDGSRLLVTFYDPETGKKVALFEPDEEAYDSVSRLCTRTVYTANFGMAYLSHVESFSEIYLQNTADADMIAELLDKLYKFYEEGEPEPLEDLKADKLCIAKSEDGNWYRAIIMSVEEDSARIQFVDYGNYEVVSKDLIKLIDEQFYNPCAFALVANLGLTPLVEDAIDKFKKEVGEAELLVTLASSDDGWRAALHKDGVDIAMSLVSQGFATLSGAEEPLVKETIDHQTNENDGREKAYVSHADTPGQFWVQLETEINRVEKIQTDLLDSESFAPLEGRELGMNCVAKYTMDEQWYRAVILDADSEIVTVRFIDYGNTDVLTDCPEVLKALPETLKGEPAGALRCSVDAVPAGTGEWLETAAEFFQTLLGNLEDPVRIKIIHPGDTNYIELIAQGKDVTKELVKAGHASLPQRTEGALTCCFASHINSPSEFWIQLESSSAELEEIEAQMVDAESFPVPPTIEENTLVAAKYPEDNAWYRAQVVAPAGDGAEVLFIDYGNACLASQLSALPESLKALPALARKCALQKPRELAVWPPKAAQKFEELAAEGATVFNIDFVAAGDISIVELKLDDQSVTDILLEFCQIDDDSQKTDAESKCEAKENMLHLNAEINYISNNALDETKDSILNLSAEGKSIPNDSFDQSEDNCETKENMLNLSAEGKAIPNDSFDQSEDNCETKESVLNLSAEGKAIPNDSFDESEDNCETKQSELNLSAEGKDIPNDSFDESKDSTFDDDTPDETNTLDSIKHDSTKINEEDTLETIHANEKANEAKGKSSDAVDNVTTQSVNAPAVDIKDSEIIDQLEESTDLDESMDSGQTIIEMNVSDAELKRNDSLEVSNDDKSSGDQASDEKRVEIKTPETTVQVVPESNKNDEATIT